MSMRKITPADLKRANILLVEIFPYGHTHPTYGAHHIVGNKYTTTKGLIRWGFNVLSPSEQVFVYPKTPKVSKPYVSSYHALTPSKFCDKLNALVEKQFTENVKKVEVRIAVVPEIDEFLFIQKPDKYGVTLQLITYNDK